MLPAVDAMEASAKNAETAMPTLPVPPRASANAVAAPTACTVVAPVTTIVWLFPMNASTLPVTFAVELLPPPPATSGTDPTTDLAVALRTVAPVAGPLVSTVRLPASSHRPLPRKARVVPSTDASTVMMPTPTNVPVPPAVSARAT